MPVHNAGAYLRPAVQSILAQQDVLLELILIDDNSTDTAIQSLPNDERLKIIQSPGRGIVTALNFGLEQARHPFIARMDGDDIAMPLRLSRQLTYLLDHPTVDIVGAKIELFKDSGAVDRGYALYQDWINALCDPLSIANNLFVESPIPHPTAFMRRSVLQNLGGYNNTDWPEDYDLWCRAHLAGLRFGKPDGDALLHWRDYDQRTSRTDQRYAKQQFIDCKAHYLSRYLKLQGHHQCSVWGAGPTGLKLHDGLLQNNVHVVQFVDINPKLKNRTKRQKPIYIIGTTPSESELRAISTPCLIAVSARGARQRIYTALNQAGLTEMQDFILAA
ncbi:glycosyltransferase [Arenicella xantha]|uniref:Glycosyl transferase family 2 n=1 Tax=Arenicella xantha TaxID=644221 RepID=A0A395JJF9_9GAMM|nr:glycosyltransferase [Arenicella xantha]RBP49191.1 glycosyl transferase family 2 [Arenicella xantha]